ncbi:MAG: hypothetical protein OHK0046_40390 [Anaerolineae bacterium]
MQRLNTLWQLASAASTVRDMAQHTRVYTFAAAKDSTFYVQAENTVLEIRRWHKPMIEVKVTLQAPFGWRVVTDFDDAGVYLVAKRRAVVGGLSSAKMAVYLPHDTYLILKLMEGTLMLDNINGTLEIPPLNAT